MSYFICYISFHSVTFHILQTVIYHRSPQSFVLLPLILQQLFIIVRIITAVGHRSSVTAHLFVPDHIRTVICQSSFIKVHLYQKSFILQRPPLLAHPSLHFSSVTVQTTRVIARHFQRSIYGILLYCLDFGAKLNRALFSKLIKEMLRLVNCFISKE